MEENPLDPWLQEIAAKAGLPAGDIDSLLTRPPERSMGDFAVPCFQLARALRKAPQAIASELASQLQPSGPVSRIEAKGPYLNFFFDPAFRTRSVLEPALRHMFPGRPAPSSAPPVVVEYSSPNIAKPFGVGHLRSTVIGNALARMFRAAGRRVIRLNFPGDWGTQFGLLLAQWIDEEKRDIPGEFDLLTTGLIFDAYKKANERQTADTEFAARGREWFRKLEEGDETATRYWQAFRDRSMEYFESIYGWLGTDNFDERNGEAFIARNEDRGNWIQKVLDVAREKGVAKPSEGALIIDLEEHGMPPVMLLKTDGTTTYHTRDLAAALYRWDKYKFERMLYVVGQDQTLHFRQISKALEILDIEPAGRIEHIPFGLIRFGEGKMSTRTGNIVMLREVIDRLRESVKDIMEESNPDLDTDSLNDLVQSATDNVALGALVFEDLGRRRIKDVDFDWDRALKLTGDTGPYLQYTYARLRSIERKAEERGVEPSEPDYSLLEGEEEDAVVNLLGQAQEALDRAVEEREPSILASYLLSLAAAVNHFYNTKRVLGEEPPIARARLALVKAVRLVMGGEPLFIEDGTTGEKTEIVGNGGLLYLLGIPAPGRM